MRRIVAGLLGATALAGCAPILEVDPARLSSQDKAPVVAFCAATASGDMDAVAAQFVPEVAEALRDAARRGAAPPLTSGGSGCEAGRVWRWGASRRFAEVRRAGGSDALDLWRGGHGRISDLIYGDGSGTLRGRLGLSSDAAAPLASMLRR